MENIAVQVKDERSAAIHPNMDTSHKVEWTRSIAEEYVWSDSVSVIYMHGKLKSILFQDTYPCCKN